MQFDLAPSVFAGTPHINLPMYAANLKVATVRFTLNNGTGSLIALKAGANVITLLSAETRRDLQDGFYRTAPSRILAVSAPAQS